MSRNAVDAALYEAYHHRQRLMLIASRNQIECGELGGGYVEGWTTTDFARYVRARDPDGMIVLCRDHGGPWQHQSERGCDEPGAMARSADSFRSDIDAGFDLLHIDTSHDSHGDAPLDDAMRRLLVLYEECVGAAHDAHRSVLFEVGFEEQGSDTGAPEQFRRQVTGLVNSLREHRLPAPTFVVGQTATKVVASENVGGIQVAPRAVSYTVTALANTCSEVGAHLKAHNGDYLSREALRLLLDSGVAAINVAPELGVCETRELIALLVELGLGKQRDAFLALAFESRAWEKWLANAPATSDEDKAVIAGHYVFATGECREIKARAQAALKGGDSVDDRLRRAVQQSLERLIAGVSAGELDTRRAGPRGRE
jgi:tagatose-1,6-bisphosphate aldolase non-catalytic subunit AgaZ/GatZ